MKRMLMATLSVMMLGLNMLAQSVYDYKVKNEDGKEVIQAYKDFYRDAAFTHYCDQSLDLKQLVNTNKCLVHIDAFDNKLLVTSCIDNLLKGAV